MWLPRRRRFVVDRRLQFYFLLTALTYASAPVLVIALALFPPLVLQLKSFEMTSREAHDSALQLLYLHDHFWLPVTIGIVAVALHSLHATHRVAGPLYRFRATFRQIENGVLPKHVRLRRNDLLGPDLEALNAMLEGLRNRAGQALKDAAALEDLIARYRAIRRETDPESGPLLEEIAAAAMRLKSGCHSLDIEE